MTKKTILCSIDFSESSVQALRWTIAMAQTHKAHVTFLYCYRLIVSDNDVESLNMKRDMESRALAQFQEIEKKFIKSTPVPYQFVTEIGFFSSRIELHMRKSPVSLLVLGNSMIKNFDEYKNLSFDQFLSAIRIPVIIAPDVSSDFIDK